MLTAGFNHVATLTNDAQRLHAFYEDVFEAEVVRNAPEVDGNDAVWLSIIKVGDRAELNVFQIEGNTEADRQVPMFGRVVSTTSPSRRPTSRPSRRSATGSSPGGRPTRS